MFDLLRLPREIRDKIYEYALIREGTTVAEAPIRSEQVPLRRTWTMRTRCEAEEGTYKELETMSYSASMSAWYTYEKSDFHGLYRRKPCPPTLNLLFASRQVYAEATPIFYGKNTFYFKFGDIAQSGMNVCQSFMLDGSPHAQRSIRHIYLIFRDNRYLPCLAYPELCEICDELCKYTALHTIEFDLLALYTFADNLEVFQECSPSNVGLAKLFKAKGLRTLVIHLAGSLTVDRLLELIKELRATWLGGLEDTLSSEDVVNACFKGWFNDRRPTFPPPKSHHYYFKTVIDLQGLGQGASDAGSGPAILQN